ncbi:WD-repeat protein RBAP1 [Carex littledalei]|uniref:WD-repeat protein RBAP1 n=1 Tax=Carex littledalei TaxID=544730 RepID=A0A833R1P6_9POAL|nr:WD-repeat protein RBAP1 [Carex littledalei]
MTERGEGSNAALSKYEGYENWKSNIPVMYDWFTNHNLVWPSFSCRFYLQGVYVVVTDGFVPHTLMITNCDVVKPRVKNAEDISQFNEEEQSPFVQRYKTLIHPGEVNRIRELPQKSTIVATHNNSPNVLLWDLEAQPNRHPVNGAPASRPDLILTGHGNDVEFALAMCPTEPFVLSGGRDNSLVLWSIQDHITSLGSTKGSPKLGPRGVFEGHDAIVEDVQFCPSSAQEFCSVGDDYRLILWDARSGNAPVVKVEKAHDADVHCVDWNAQNENLILTGSADKTVHLLDRRKMFVGGVVLPIHKFEGHKDHIFYEPQWCPDRASVLASAGLDDFLNIWVHDKVIGNNNENIFTLCQLSRAQLDLGVGEEKNKKRDENRKKKKKEEMLVRKERVWAAKRLKRLD